jgi:serine/threonine protein phosphatase 1
VRLNLFRRKPRSLRFATPPLTRIYAVGDVHGRADLLRPMLQWIRQDSDARDDGVSVHLIFLGDLIDRGPQSAAVIDLLLAEQGNSFAQLHVVRGNHEQVLLDLLDGNVATVADWLDFGGADTLHSYGVDPALYWRDADAFLAALRAAVPASHVAFFRDTVDWVRLGDYLFVHAGIRPGVTIEQQTGDDLRWIRGDFLSSKVDHGAMVVHGHTVSARVDWQASRIGIDTGAYDSGRLTVLGLEGRRRWTLSTRTDRS